MTASFEKTGVNTGTLSFSIDQETIKNGLDKAFNKVKGNISVPGFRKGKISRQMFNRMYGEEALFEEALNAVLPTAYDAAVKEAGIEPVAQPKIDVTKMEKGSDWELTAEVTVKPEEELGDYKNLEVSVEATKDVADEEVEALCDFVKNQGESQYDEEIAKEIEAKAVQDKKSSPFEDDGDGEQLDVLFDKAVDIVLETGTASTSFLQRKLSVGYARGAKIIDQLEDKGIIGPANGSKGREILINRQQWLEMQAYSSSQPFTAENTEQMSFDNEDTLDDGIVSENYDDLD